MRVVVTWLTNSKNVMDASGITFILDTAFSLGMEVVLAGDTLAKGAKILVSSVTCINYTNSDSLVWVSVVCTV